MALIKQNVNSLLWHFSFLYNSWESALFLRETSKLVYLEPSFWQSVLPLFFFFSLDTLRKATLTSPAAAKAHAVTNKHNADQRQAAHVSDSWQRTTLHSGKILSGLLTLTMGLRWCQVSGLPVLQSITTQEVRVALTRALHHLASSRVTT